MEAKLDERRGRALAEESARAGERSGRHAADATGARTIATKTGALGDARLLLLGMWLGAAALLSFAVAPGAFAVLPARELAGAIVSRTIAVVNVSGFLAALLLLATAFGRGSVARARRAFVVELCALACLALATGAGHWLVSARMAALRAAMARPIDEVAANDPLRVAFNSMHGYSVAAMLAAMLAAVIAFILIARRNRNA